jgi:hypothetical protein
MTPATRQKLLDPPTAIKEPLQLTTCMPMRLQRRGGRKLIPTPEGAMPTPKPRPDETLVKALV